MMKSCKIIFLLVLLTGGRQAIAQSSMYKDLFVRPDLSPSAGSDTTKVYFQMLVNVDSVYSGTSLNMLIGSQQDSSDASSFIAPATISGNQQYYTLGGAIFFIKTHFLSISFSLPKSMLGLVSYITVFSTTGSNSVNSNKLYYKF